MYIVQQIRQLHRERPQVPGLTDCNCRPERGAGLRGLGQQFWRLPAPAPHPAPPAPATGPRHRLTLLLPPAATAVLLAGHPAPQTHHCQAAQQGIAKNHFTLSEQERFNLGIPTLVRSKVSGDTAVRMKLRFKGAVRSQA